MDDARSKRRKRQGWRTEPVVVLEPVLVPITDEEDRRALEALIERRIPLFAESQLEDTKDNE
jgi:hypothetical protein